MMLDDLQERWPELRDPAGWHEAGLPLGTADERCALLLDLACRVAFTFSCPRYAGLDASKVAAAAVDADPDCLFAHTTSLAVRLIGGGKGAAAQALDRAVKCCATSRACHSQWERGHLAAVRTYASADDTEVGRMYGELVRAYPFDVLALRLAFMANSPARRRVLLRNTQAVIPHWQRRWRRQQQEQQQEQRDDHDGTDGCAPGSLYPFVLGEHSYALGENERYEESEQFARRALHLNRNCSLSTHQMAHIFEMTGRFAEGADFLRATEKDWRLAGQATHIYWHWSILHVGQQRGHGQHESDKSTALELFDRTLATARRDDAAGARALSKCVNDLASLLFRLFLADAGGVGGAGGGSDAGSGVTALRQRLAERAQTVLGIDRVQRLIGAPTGSAALDVHLAMLLSVAGRHDELRAHVRAISRDPARVSVHSVAAATLTTALSAAVSLVCRGRWDEAAAQLQAVEPVCGLLPEAWRPLGLSNAQRDVFTQLYLRALVSSRRPDPERLSRASRMISARERVRKDAALYTAKRVEAARL